MTRTGETRGLALWRNGYGNRRPAGGLFGPGVWFEALEPRRLMSGVTLGADGILVVEGSEGVDEISIYRLRLDDGPLVVNGRAYPMPGDVGPVRDIWGVFPRDAVRGIRVYGLGGDDLIRVMNSPDLWWSAWDPAGADDYGRLHIPVTLDGGAGDDELISQSEADDVIVGGAGRDRGYAIDGHDRFAVEMVGDYRDARAWVDADGEHRAEFGTFTWNGGEDELFADPWQAPNQKGSYAGPNAPDFTVTPDGDGGGGGGDDGGGDDAGGSGGDAYIPALDVPVSGSPAATVSASAERRLYEDVWDDAAVDFL